MAAEHDPNDDLYSYDGYDKATFGFLIEPDVRQPRQDSGVDIQMPEAIHNEAVGTLFASQAATDIPSQATTHIAPRQTINAETQTQHGSESSVFACYDAIAETKRGDTHHTIFELRRWLGRFKLPQAARADDKGDFTVENEASHHLFRQRSLSAQAAKLAASEFPLQRLADDSIDGNESATHKPEDDDAGPSIMDERLNLLLSIALPQSPIERTCEWDERQRAREEYDSIERAHAIRLEADQRSAQTRERNLEISENNWKEAEVDRKRAESSWPNGSLEASVVQELEHGDELASQMSSMINYMDSGLYIIPRMWDFTDPTRRTRLYSNTYSFLRYMMRERKVVYLLGTRFEDLQQGRSNQPEAAITEEMKTLENAMEVRCNAEVDYFNLLCDFLNWAIAHTTLEFRDMTNGGPEPTRPNALTNDIPISVVEDMIEVEAELMKRYERLRDLEQAYFPKRFIVDPLPSEPPPTQTKPQYTPRGRQIPVRQQMPPQDDSADEYDLGDEAQFGERLTRTLPRPFRPQNTPLLRVMRFDPHPVPTLDKKMTGEPTSPVKPPETDYLRPPKQKRKLPLRMLNYPHTIEEYTPESLSPFKPWNLTTARVRHKSQTGIGVSERTLRRSTLQKQFVSLDRVKRERALREPWTPDNIDRVIECNWREDLRYMQRCRSLAEYNSLFLSLQRCTATC
ncbi:uncharacterized protein M421DRAFT_189586 [Didymella exigua CBS 183.55]|uniref:Uncharacterized protein n=1 Tax=Didymella exigua CBS 183.55 TaxID=1150837 RepID=A0A6A5RFI0_9PLEO|nr:uncharacterized protein M421DRAFT_189586 [Didymella exigua CBS 183.55]KAF1927045.1 hypothetical protein M421DRAFT_189586 [Didymella exigua CBS 183.55]